LLPVQRVLLERVLGARKALAAHKSSSSLQYWHGQQALMRCEHGCMAGDKAHPSSLLTPPIEHG
jgi:hypothetical protein